MAKKRTGGSQPHVAFSPRPAKQPRLETERQHSPHSQQHPQTHRTYSSLQAQAWPGHPLALQPPGVQFNPRMNGLVFYPQQQGFPGPHLHQVVPVVFPGLFPAGQNATLITRPGSALKVQNVPQRRNCNTLSQPALKMTVPSSPGMSLCSQSSRPMLTSLCPQTPSQQQTSLCPKSHLLPAQASLLSVGRADSLPSTATVAKQRSDSSKVVACSSAQFLREPRKLSSPFESSLSQQHVRSAPNISIAPKLSNAPCSWPLSTQRGSATLNTPKAPNTPNASNKLCSRSPNARRKPAAPHVAGASNSLSVLGTSSSLNVSRTTTTPWPNFFDVSTAHLNIPSTSSNHDSSISVATAAGMVPPLPMTSAGCCKPAESNTVASTVQAPSQLSTSATQGCTQAISHCCSPEALRHSTSEYRITPNAMVVPNKTVPASLDKPASRGTPAIPVRLSLISRPLIIRALPKTKKLGSPRPVTTETRQSVSRLRSSRERTSPWTCNRLANDRQSDPSVPASIPSVPTTVHLIPASVPFSIPASVPSKSASLSSSVPASLPFCAPASFLSPVRASLPSSVLASLPSSVAASLHSSVPASVPASLSSSLPASLPSSVSASLPSSVPASLSSSLPTNLPSSVPASLPSSLPTSLSSSVPASLPSSGPDSLPPSVPASLSSSVPASLPSSIPASLPSSVPASLPSSVPASLPSSVPASLPSSLLASLPLSAPDSLPSSGPDSLPSSVPASFLSSVPASLPSSVPASLPSSVPAGLPSSVPASLPSSLLASLPFSAPASLPSSGPESLPPFVSASLPSFVSSSLPSSVPSSILFSVPASLHSSVTVSLQSSVPASLPFPLLASLLSSAPARCSPVTNENIPNVTESKCSLHSSPKFRTAAELVKVRARPKSSYREALTPLLKPVPKRRKRARPKRATVAKQANDSQSCQKRLTEATMTHLRRFVADAVEETYVRAHDVPTDCRSVPTRKITSPPTVSPVKPQKPVTETTERQFFPETFRPLSSSSPKHPHSPSSCPSSLLLPPSPLRHQSPSPTTEYTQSGLLGRDPDSERSCSCKQSDDSRRSNLSKTNSATPQQAEPEELAEGSCEGFKITTLMNAREMKTPEYGSPAPERFRNFTVRDESSKVNNSDDTTISELDLGQEKLGDCDPSPDRPTTDPLWNSRLETVKLELHREEETILYPIDDDSEASDSPSCGSRVFSCPPVSIAALRHEMQEDENFGSHLPFPIMPAQIKQEVQEKDCENIRYHTAGESTEVIPEHHSPGKYSTSSSNSGSLGHADLKLEAGKVIYPPVASPIDADEKAQKSTDLRKTCDLHNERVESHQSGYTATVQESEVSSWRGTSVPSQQPEGGTDNLRSSTTSPSSESSFSSPSLQEEAKTACRSPSFFLSIPSSEMSFTPRPQQSRREEFGPRPSSRAVTSSSAPSSLSPSSSALSGIRHTSPQRISSPEETASLVQPTTSSSSPSSISPSSSSPSRRLHTSPPQRSLLESDTTPQQQSTTPSHPTPSRRGSEDWNTAPCGQVLADQVQRLQELCLVLSNQSEILTDSSNHCRQFQVSVANTMGQFHSSVVLPLAQQGTLLTDHFGRLQRQIQSMQHQLANLQQQQCEIKQLLQQQRQKPKPRKSLRR